MVSFDQKVTLISYNTVCVINYSTVLPTRDIRTTMISINLSGTCCKRGLRWCNITVVFLNESPVNNSHSNLRTN